jgi:outer membrane protein TolC
VPEIGVSVPEAWQSRSTSTVPETVLEEWWLTFGDPQLNELIAEALLGNHDLKAAAARLESAAAEARIAGADLWPQANGRVEASRQRQNLLVPRLGGGGEDVMSQTSNNFGVSLNVSWELDVWGRIRSAAAAAVANVQSQRADYAAATLSLAAQTTKSWFAVIESRQQVELAEATVVSYRETARQANDRVEGGEQSPVDQDQALANLSSAESLQQDRRQMHDDAQLQLEE